MALPLQKFAAYPINRYTNEQSAQPFNRPLYTYDQFLPNPPAR